jgi:hypothetical protein
MDELIANDNLHEDLDYGYIHALVNPLLEYVKSSQIIEYNNSGFKSFNDCHSIRLQNNGLSPLTAKLRYEYELPGLTLSFNKFREIWDLSITHDLSSVVDQYVTSDSNKDPIDPYLLDSDDFDSKLLQHLDIALDEMIPSLDSGFSLPVFIFEIIELKALFKGISAVFTKLPKHAKKLFKNPKKELSSGYLSAIFGWIPLVRDLETIMTKIVLLQSTVEAYILDQNIRRTFHFRKALNPETFQDSDWFDWTDFTEYVIDEEDYPQSARDSLVMAFYDLSYKVRTKKSVTDLKFHATMDYTYSIPNFGRTVKFLGALDKFGIQLSVKDVWEIIPFSFVVDWVFDIGSMLEEFQLEHLPVEVVIHDFCYSYSYKFSEEAEIVVNDVSYAVNTSELIAKTGIEYLHRQYAIDPLSFPLPPAQTAGSVDLDVFHRWAEMPPEISTRLADVNLPSGKEFVTFSALVLANKR